jgi:hypothetical protein
MSRVAVIYRTWLCLASLSNSNSDRIQFLNCDKSSASLSSQTTKSYVQVVANSCIIHFSELASLCIKGKDLSIKITKSKYLVGFADCQNILHGCLYCSKSSNPMCLVELKEKNTKFWKTNASWSTVSLGKGYYEFDFFLWRTSVLLDLFTKQIIINYGGCIC